MVSLVPRPQWRCTAMDTAVPSGRATKATASRPNAARVPFSGDRKGNRKAGNTSTQAIPKTKKSKYSDERPMMTPTAISPEVTSSWVSARERAEGLSSKPAWGWAARAGLLMKKSPVGRVA